MKKIPSLRVWPRKVVLALYVAVAGKGRSSFVHRIIECNKYDLTAAQCFWLAHHNDSSRWFPIISGPPICCPNFSFVGGVAKQYSTKLGCEKYFPRVPYWAPLEILLVATECLTYSPTLIVITHIPYLLTFATQELR